MSHKTVGTHDGCASHYCYGTHGKRASQASHETQDNFVSQGIYKAQKTITMQIIQKTNPTEGAINAASRRLASIFSDLQRTIPISEVEEALNLGQPLLLVEKVDWDTGLVQPLSEELHQDRAFQFERGGKAGVTAVPSGIAFDITNPRAVEFMERFGAELVTNITEETMNGIRAIMVDAFKNGEGGYKAARSLRSSVGLTERQGLALQRYRRGLEAEGLPSTLVDKRVNRYYTKLNNYRAERIARTELNRAANHGELEGWRQLADKGYIDRDTSRKCWMSSGLPNMCAECEAAEGQCVPLNEPFSIGVDAPGAHPSCGCTMYLQAGKPSEGPQQTPEQWAKGLSDTELKTMDFWQREGYTNIRAAERGLIKPDPALAKAEANFHEMLNTAPKYEGTVHRGIYNLNDDTYQAIINAGKEPITFDASTSASMSRDVAVQFGNDGTTGRTILFDIKTKTGVDVDGASNVLHLDEREVILRKGTKYHLVRVDELGEVGEMPGVSWTRVTLEEI